MLDQKFALVLGGGGAKGSYEIGVWKALRELHIKFNAVSGSSVGALNGSFVVQNDYNKALDLWNTVSIRDIVDIPETLIQDGKLNLDRENLKKLKGIQADLIENRGFDTAPLRRLIEKYLDEKRMRKSRVDFAIITYDISSFKPVEKFLENIKYGEVVDYLLGSAALPGFRFPRIDDKILIDGGFYDVIPFTTLKKRGYRNFIIVDVSGIGFSKKVEHEGCRITYIKNSSDLGGLLEFTPERAWYNMKMGYLDCLRTFGKISGITYFYSEDDSIAEKLTHILFSFEAVEEYRTYFDDDRDISIEQKLRNCLPRHCQLHKEIIYALAECAAQSVNLEHVELYSFKDFLERIDDKKNELKFTADRKSKPGKLKSFEQIFRSLKEYKNIFKIPHFEYYNLFHYLFEEKKNSIIYTKTLSSIFSEVLPAKIFFLVLELYFKKGQK